MKKILLISLLPALLLAGCDTESPMEQNLYPQKVYIVGAKDRIIDRDLNIGNAQNTISISVAVSGSLNLSQDVTVAVAEDPDAIETYNSRELSAEVVHYQKLQDDIYTYPSDKVIIKAGSIYNTYPVYIQPATLNCDSLYMLPLKLVSTSAHELNREDTIALVRINLVNKYSGLYYVDGVLKNTSNTNDSLVYRMPRTLAATGDGNTVRMYHYNNVFHNGDANDYRLTHTFKITVNPDNSLSLATWNRFELIDGGGIYRPELKLYDFWYTYRDNGTIWRAEGFLYKERKTDEEQRVIDDWIEEQRQ
jgi:hypothetical protein